MVKFKSSIGSTTGTTSQFLVDDDTKWTDPSTDNGLLVGSTDILDDLYAKATKGNIYLDATIVSAAHTSRPKGIYASHISKIWIIDLDSAKRTLEVTSQNSRRSNNPNLSSNYETNDLMLRYKVIKENLFTETFFSTKTAAKSSQGNTCCQLFVTDKGFVYVVPVKSKSEFIQAVKKFAKEIGPPNAIISDAPGEKTPKALIK